MSDETWIYSYDPETSQQSSQLNHQAKSNIRGRCAEMVEIQRKMQEAFDRITNDDLRKCL